MKKFNKKVWIPIIVLLSIILIGGIVYLSLLFTVFSTKLNISVQQVGEEQNINVTWNTTKPVNKVTINVKHDGSIVNSVTLKNSSLIAKGNYTVPAFYGKHNVEVIVYRDGGYFTSETTTAKVFASEYNIAPITATMPVTIFSLSLKDITDDYTIPTFVWFKRSEAWDYSQMPNKVYTMPVASYSEIIGNCDQSLIYSRTTKWVKELYDINPNSHFNFFYNDYDAHGWLQATVANKIPVSNYNVTLLSDGNDSSYSFNKHFNNIENSANEAEYTRMKAQYEKLKTQIASRGKYSEDDRNFEISVDSLKEYAYIMTKEEPNVEWWLSRISGTMAPANADMYNEVATNPKIKVKDLNTLLNAFSEEEKDQLKKLYNFSDTMFDKAAQENKKVMVLLGTWTYNEHNFKEYVGAMKAYYGDSYVYYYKGHPRNPTNSEPGKLENLKSLGLIDIDSTIPAELIFFFNPNAVGVGYQSTTYVSLTDEQSGCIWNVRKDSFGESYKNKIEIFVTKANPDDAVYGSLIKNFDSVLIEFRDTTKYDVAIYDSNNKTIKYYKLENSVFVEVQK